MGDPIVLVVTDKESVRAALVGDLRRRFGADYRVVGVGSGAMADAVGRSEEAALVIADQSMAGTSPRTHRSCPCGSSALDPRRGLMSCATP